MYYKYEILQYATNTEAGQFFQLLFPLFLYNLQLCGINRRELALLREQATSGLDNLPLRDLADLEPVLLG